MRARRSPWLAVLALFTGGALASVATTAGCGSKTDEGTITPNNDTGLVLAEASPDTTPADTGSTMVDSEKQYDVPGSLFDVTVPDIQFEGGKSVGGCFACTTDKCKAEVTECDKDPKCRGLVLCGLTDCAGNFSDFGCLLGCAGKYDVSPSPSDPTVAKALGVGNCVQNKCAADCPLPPMMGGDAKVDTKADTTSEAATDSAPEASAFMIFPNASKEQMSYDPAVMEQLQQLFMTLGGQPDVRASLIDSYSSH